ncbi:sodium:calcium antiporter [Rhodopila sp.]|uniref:sodium:calcium antiporter n=1 Tax=Rhodopila sp. TaxID=2480087 RepID=UPI003D102820
MSIGSAVILFLGCLVLGTISSAVLSHRLDQVGTYLGLSEGLLGLVTALGADSPEIATAVTALVGGQHDLGRGVIFGSNLFNLAALFGLGAVVAGRLACGRETLLLNAGVAVSITGVLAWQLLTDGSPLVGGALIAAVMLPYVAVSALKPRQLRSPLLPGPMLRWLQEAVRDAEVDSGGERFPTPPSWADKLAVVPLLGMVVVSSIGIVRAATVLGADLAVPDAVLGTLVLATLTGIPNAVAAIRLAVQGRGAAVVSETFNSNSLNLIAGAYLPTLFVTAAPLSGAGRMVLWWLLGGTLLAAALFLRRAVLTRWEGAVLIVGYAVFAILVAVG